MFFQTLLFFCRIDAGQMHAMETTVLFGLVPVGLEERISINKILKEPF
jgi:hypothetical protein